MVWRTLQIVIVPPLVIAGYLLSFEAGGWVRSTWDDFLGPFLITYWLGLGFLNTWDIIRYQVRGARPSVVAATVGVVLVVLLVTVGPGELLDDPWMFGIVIAPAIDLALPYIQGRRTMNHEDAAPSGTDTAG